MLKLSIFISALVISLHIFSQTPVWKTLPNSPSTNWRHDDLSFINERTGWVTYNTAFGGGNNGRVYKTTDGGNSWVLQMNVSNKYLRCIGFIDSLKGWVGTLGNVSGLNPGPILYQTTNGGISWDTVTFTTVRPRGLCGISIFDGSYLFAVGRVSGPPYFIKSTDGGLSWISTEMSAYASQLVDCKFFSPDSGFAVGAVGTPVVTNSKSVILFTSDGGSSWVERYRGNELVQYNSAWKITFAGRNFGIATIDDYNDTLFIIKTTNGGNNWQKINIYTGTVAIFTQGTGFINENTGWVGGDELKTFKTTNSGTTWQFDNFGSYINRIRFINDSIGYACGKRIYKFTSEPIGIKQISSEIPKGFILYQNYPNPFNLLTKIKFDIAKQGIVIMRIYDVLGRVVITLVNKSLNPGEYETEWNASDYPSGIYYYTISIDNFSGSKKMILLK